MRDIKEVQAYLDDNLDAYLEILRQMVTINSFTSNPAGVNQLAKLTADIFAPFAFSEEFVQSRNPSFGRHLFLKRPANFDPNDHPPKDGPEEALNPSAPTIALVSHLDTVFPPEEEQENNFTWNPSGDRIFGPGTVDIKGGTVMIYIVLDLLRKFEREFFDGVNWLIGVNASEEALSNDFGQACLARLPEETLACLVFEGGTISEKTYPIVISRKGRATFHIKVEGRSAHAGNSHAFGANAIHELAHVIKKVEGFTDYEQQITFNVGVVNGGSVVNRVPHLAEAIVEMRAFSPQVFQAGVEQMKSLVYSNNVSSADGFSCRVSVEIMDRTAPWPTNSGAEKLLNIWQEAGRELGFKVIPEYRGGLSDGNLLWESHPTIDGLGPSGANAHCSEQSADGSKEQEFVWIPSIKPKALLNLIAITNLIEKNNNI